MFPVRRKISGTGLLVKTVEWGDGKERGYLNHCFQLDGIGIDSPIVVVEPVPASYNEFVAYEITGP